MRKLNIHLYGNDNYCIGGVKAFVLNHGFTVDTQEGLKGINSGEQPRSHSQPKTELVKHAHVRLKFCQRQHLSDTQIEKALKEQASNTEKIARLDRTLDLHIQEYVNRKDVVQMVLGQLDQKINHKFKRLLFYTRDIQRFLHKGGNFTIREYEENTEEE